MADTPKEDIKHSKIWMRDSSGLRSASVTLLWISFLVTTVGYLLALVENIGTIKIRPFIVAGSGSYCLPILTMYTGRKWTKAKYVTKTSSVEQSFEESKQE